jgi:hypothetical protein
MAIKRVRNRQVELKVLLKNRRTCCVCHEPDKAIQLHHIDGNPTHTVEANLAALCLTHHDQATAGLVKGGIGLGVKLSPEEVRVHKTAWENVVTNQAKASPKTASEPKSKQFLRDFEFEVMKIKSEILVTSNQAIVKNRLEYLSQFVIEEFITGIPFRSILLDAYGDMSLRSAGDENISRSLLWAIGDLHVHLAGPEYVAIDRRDKDALLGSLELLETIGSFGVYLIRDPHVVKRTCKILIELAEICTLYKWYDFTTKAKKVLKAVRKECDDVSANELITYRVKEKIKWIEEANKAI